jgi:glucose/arabinose dehydrogenase
VTEVANLTNKGVLASVAGLYWYKGAFYFTHRDPTDRTDAVSRMTMDGTVTRILSGLPDGPSEHQANDIRVGPDGRMYLAVGPAGNSAVMGIDNAPNITRVPTVHTTPCVDYVLTGMNFETPDFRTPDQSDKVRTGAFVPFGTATTPGQKIPGAQKCGGAIFAFDPNNAEATLRVFAHGLRNVIGLTWNTKGEMFAAVNGYDVRGSRPVNDPFDATYRIREGVWYGWPDYSAALEPLTDPKFDVPDTLKVPIYVNGQLQPMKLGFVIDHAASRLTPPDRSLVYGLHEGDSSPSLLDVAPASWGDLAGQVFVAEWGDLAPGTNPLLAKPVGYRVSRIDPATGRAVPFVQNVKPGPASKQGAMGLGIERPFDVKFGPDGAMYIADYGVANVNMARIKEGKLPYEFPPQTGAIWKVTRMAGAPAPAPMPPAPAPPAPPAPPPAMPGLPNTGGGGLLANWDRWGSVLPVSMLILVLQRHLSCSSVPRRVRSRTTKLPLAGRSPVRTSKCRCSTSSRPRRRSDAGAASSQAALTLATVSSGNNLCEGTLEASAGLWNRAIPQSETASRGARGIPRAPRDADEP